MGKKEALRKAKGALERALERTDDQEKKDEIEFLLKRLYDTDQLPNKQTAD